MFSYYGSKSKIVKYYPPPKYDMIIEPFAGSARYSLLYPEKKVILNDIDPIISGIWSYLKDASIDNILSLPVLSCGDSLDNYPCLTKVEKDLMGFMVCVGVPSPRKVCASWAACNNNIEKTKNRILNYLTKIRHWQVTQLDYNLLDNVEATWFIDPPYQNGGAAYVFNYIDYGKLADWVKTRKGQVIVCENEPANWLDFKFLVKMHGRTRTKTELIWTN